MYRGPEVRCWLMAFCHHCKCDLLYECVGRITLVINSLKVYGRHIDIPVYLGQLSRSLNCPGNISFHVVMGIIEYQL